MFATGANSLSESHLRQLQGRSCRPESEVGRLPTSIGSNSLVEFGTVVGVGTVGSDEEAHASVTFLSFHPLLPCKANRGEFVEGSEERSGRAASDRGCAARPRPLCRALRNQFRACLCLHRAARA